MKIKNQKWRRPDKDSQKSQKLQNLVFQPLNSLKSITSKLYQTLGLEPIQHQKHTVFGYFS